MQDPTWEDVERIVRVVRSRSGGSGVADTLAELDEHLSSLVPSTACLFTPVYGVQPSVDQVGGWVRAPAYSRDYDPEWAELFQSHASDDRTTPAMLARPGELIDPRSLYSPEEIKRSPYWNEFVHATGLQTGRGLFLATHEGHGVALSFFRTAGAGEFTGREERILQLLLPDLTRLLRSAIYLDRLAQVERLGSEARLAVMTVGETGELLSASAATEALLKEAGWTAEEACEALCASTSPDTLRIQTQAGTWLELVHMELPDRSRLITMAELPPGSLAAFAATIEQLGLGLRQTEVATLVCDGYSNSEIAYRMRVSPETVKRHLAVVYAKAGVSSRPELVKRLFGIPRMDGR